MYQFTLENAVTFFEDAPHKTKDQTAYSSYSRFVQKYKMDIEEVKEIRAFLANAHEALFTNNQTYNHLLNLIFSKYHAVLSVLINSTQGYISDLEKDADNNLQLIADNKSDLITYKAELNDINTYKAILEKEAENLIELEVTKVSGGYQKGWNLAEKSKFILTNEQKVLTLPQILDKILTYEPELAGDKAEKRKVQANLSGTLKFYIDKNIFKRISNTYDNAHFLYGLHAWFDQEDKLADEYLPQDLKTA